MTRNVRTEHGSRGEAKKMLRGAKGKGKKGTVCKEVGSAHEDIQRDGLEEGPKSNKGCQRRFDVWVSLLERFKLEVAYGEA